MTFKLNLRCQWGSILVLILHHMEAHSEPNVTIVSSLEETAREVVFATKPRGSAASDSFDRVFWVEELDISGNRSNKKGFSV